MEEKIRQLLKNFNDLVLTEVQNETKSDKEKSTAIKNQNDKLTKEYFYSFPNFEEARNFPYEIIMNEVENNFLKGYYEFMCMVIKKIQKKELNEKEAHLALSERPQIDIYFEYVDLLKKIDRYESTNDDFEDLLELQIILTAQEWFCIIYDEISPKLKEKFPNLTAEIDSFDRSRVKRLTESIQSSLYKLDSKDNYNKIRNYLNIENYVEELKLSAKGNPFWEYQEDPVYRRVRCLTFEIYDDFTPQDIVLLIQKFRNDSTEAVKSFEEQFKFETIKLIVDYFSSSRGVKKSSDLELILSRLDVKVIEKSNLTMEEKYLVLKGFIKIIEEIGRTTYEHPFLKDDTVKCICVLGSLLGVEKYLSADEFSEVFNKRILNSSEFNLKNILIAGYNEKLNTQTFSVVIGITHHLGLITFTYKDYLANYTY